MPAVKPAGGTRLLGTTAEYGEEELILFPAGTRRQGAGVVPVLNLDSKVWGPGSAFEGSEWVGVVGGVWGGADVPTEECLVGFHCRVCWVSKGVS